MNTTASKSASGGWVLVVVGLIWFLVTLVLGFHAFSKWQLDAQLDAHGLSIPAVIESVEGVRGEKGSFSYHVAYTFQPPGQPKQVGEVALTRDEARTLLGTYPDGYTRGNRPGSVRYLPEDPSRNRLEGAKASSSLLPGFLFSLLFFGGFAAAGIGLMVTGVRMSLPDPALSALPSQESLREPGCRVPLGPLTYLSQPQRAVFRPSASMSLGVLLIGGAFGLLTSYLTLFVVAAALNLMFGWEFPGLVMNAMSSSQSNPPAPFGLVMLGISLLPGVFAAFLLAMVVQMLHFWRHPTVLDYTAGVFRRGGQEVCRLSAIREVCLRRITDSNYPGKAKVGLALVLLDGSLHCLEPRSAFLSRFGNQVKDPFTDLGELREGYPQEAVRGVAAEVAAQLGVPLQEREERGSLAPDQSRMGM